MFFGADAIGCTAVDRDAVEGAAGTGNTVGNLDGSNLNSTSEQSR